MGRTFLMQYGRVAACFLMLLVTAAPVQALSNATGPNGSNVQAVHTLGYTGQNVKIGLISAAHARVTHEAFDGAVNGMMPQVKMSMNNFGMIPLWPGF